MQFGPASLPQIRDYFGMTPSELRQEWMALDDAEKDFFRLSVGAVLEIPTVNVLHHRYTTPEKSTSIE